MALTKTSFKKGNKIGVKALERYRKTPKYLVDIEKVKFKKGKEHPFWKGGISRIGTIIRRTPEARLWVKSILIRDNFTCQKTGKRGGDLEVHHINNFADFPEVRFALDNGITLSKQAHKQFHSIYGIKNNTKEQLQEFLNT